MLIEGVMLKESRELVVKKGKSSHRKRDKKDV